VLGFDHRPAVLDNPWCAAEAQVTTFQIHELLGTKLRALYQRRRGRDLFDLSLSISRGMLDHKRVLACFSEYMTRQGHSVSRAQFEQNLHDKESDPAFLEDIKPLLRADIDYNAATAMKQVRALRPLLTLLPPVQNPGVLVAPQGRAALFLPLRCELCRHVVSSRHVLREVTSNTMSGQSLVLSSHSETA